MRTVGRHSSITGVRWTVGGFNCRDSGPPTHPLNLHATRIILLHKVELRYANETGRPLN